MNVNEQMSLDFFCGFSVQNHLHLSSSYTIEEKPYQGLEQAVSPGAEFQKMSLDEVLHDVMIYIHNFQYVNKYRNIRVTKNRPITLDVCGYCQL